LRVILSLTLLCCVTVQAGDHIPAVRRNISTHALVGDVARDASLQTLSLAPHIPDASPTPSSDEAPNPAHVYPIPSSSTGLLGYSGAILGVAADNSGGFYVSVSVESGYSHVLYYPSGSTTATRVYGAPSVPNTMPYISATSLDFAFGVATDKDGGLYIADEGNNRVLYYPSGSTTATRVYGQPNFSSNTLTSVDRLPAAPTPTPSELRNQGLAQPRAVAVTSDGDVYVSDLSNQRILYYPPGSTRATRFFRLGPVYGLAVDGDGGLYLAAIPLLYLPRGSTTPTIYTTRADAQAVAVDKAGGIYVGDDRHGVRVLYYPPQGSHPPSPSPPPASPSHGTSESPEISTRCLEYNIKAQRRDSIRVVLPSNKPVPWSGTVTTFCDADPQATWQSYEASVIWNDKQIDLDTQASSLPAGQDTQMRIAAAIRNMAQSGLTTPASILSDNGGTRTAATIRPLGQGRYAIVASHRFSAPGHEHMMVIIQTRGRAHNAAPEFAYTEITAYVDSKPDTTMIAAGRAQARRFGRYNTMDSSARYYATEALLAHSTNPWFTVGFFNGLDYHKQDYYSDGLTLLLEERDALASVMGFKKYTADQVDRHMIQAIVSALASGHASSAFTFAVLFRLRQETSGQGGPGDDGSYAGPFSYYDLGSAIAANVAAANNLVNLSYYNFDNFLNQRAFGENDYVMDDIAATIVADHIGIYATTNWAEATDADRQKSKYWQLLLVATQVPEGTTVAPTLAKLELAMGVWAGIHMPQHLVLSTCVKGRCRTDPYSGEIWAKRTGYLARNLAEASVTHINDSNAARTLRANIYAGIAFWALPFAVPLAGDAIASFTAIEVSKGLVTAVADSVGLGSAIAVPFLPLGPSASDVSNVLRVTYAAQRQAAAKLIARLLLLHHVLLDCAAYPSHPCTPAPSLDLRSQPHGQVDNIECHGNDIVDRVAADGDVIDCAMRPNAAFILKDQFGHYSGMEARSNVFNYMLIWLPN